eukprot:scaffold191_cov111-Isochrysis_galbana.AAC.4
MILRSKNALSAPRCQKRLALVEPRLLAPRNILVEHGRAALMRSSRSHVPSPRPPAREHVAPGTLGHVSAAPPAARRPAPVVARAPLRQGIGVCVARGLLPPPGRLGRQAAYIGRGGPAAVDRAHLPLACHPFRQRRQVVHRQPPPRPAEVGARPGVPVAVEAGEPNHLFPTVRHGVRGPAVDQARLPVVGTQVVAVHAVGRHAHQVHTLRGGQQQQPRLLRLAHTVRLNLLQVQPLPILATGTAQPRQLEPAGAPARDGAPRRRDGLRRQRRVVHRQPASRATQVALWPRPPLAGRLASVAVPEHAHRVAALPDARVGEAAIHDLRPAAVRPNVLPVDAFGRRSYQVHDRSRPLQLGGDGHGVLAHGGVGGGAGHSRQAAHFGRGDPPTPVGRAHLPFGRHPLWQRRPVEHSQPAARGAEVGARPGVPVAVGPREPEHLGGVVRHGVRHPAIDQLGLPLVHAQVVPVHTARQVTHQIDSRSRVGKLLPRLLLLGGGLGGRALVGLLGGILNLARDAVQILHRNHGRGKAGLGPSAGGGTVRQVGVLRRHGRASAATRPPGALACPAR